MGAQLDKQADDVRFSLNVAAKRGTYPEPGTAEEVKRLAEEGKLREAFELVEATATENPKQDMFWLHMGFAAEGLGLQERAARYHAKYEAANSGQSRPSGPSPEERVIKSDLSVREGMSEVIDAYAQSHPHRDWDRFRTLDFEDDLQHLKGWFESLLTSDPPGAGITGLWFGLINPYRGGVPTADLYIRGSTYDYEDEDWVLRTGWDPAASEARSRVLYAIYRIAYPPFGATGDSSPEVQEAYREATENLLGDTAEYSLGFAYAGLVVRWLAGEIERELLLGDAPERVLFTGFDDGDWLCVGALRPEGFVISSQAERMA